MAGRRKDLSIVRSYKVLKGYVELPKPSEENREAIIGIVRAMYPPSVGNKVRFHGRPIEGYSNETLHEIAETVYERAQRAIEQLPSEAATSLLDELSVLDDVALIRRRLIFSIVNTETSRRSREDCRSSKREDLEGYDRRLEEVKASFLENFGKAELTEEEKGLVNRAYNQLLDET